MTLPGGLEGSWNNLLQSSTIHLLLVENHLRKNFIFRLYFWKKKFDCKNKIFLYSIFWVKNTKKRKSKTEHKRDMEMHTNHNSPVPWVPGMQRTSILKVRFDISWLGLGSREIMAGFLTSDETWSVMWITKTFSKNGFKIGHMVLTTVQDVWDCNSQYNIEYVLKWHSRVYSTIGWNCF